MASTVDDIVGVECFSWAVNILALQTSCPWCGSQWFIFVYRWWIHFSQSGKVSSLQGPNTAPLWSMTFFNSYLYNLAVPSCFLKVVMIIVKYKLDECYYIFEFFPLYTRWRDHTTTDINKVVHISHGQDLWRLDLNTNVWEQLNLKGAPSPRSGHRMVFALHEVFMYLRECICGCKDECCC